MKNIQKQIIKDFASNVEGALSDQESFNLLADQWELDPLFTRVLGEDGRVSFPARRKEIEIGNLDRSINSFASDLRHVFKGWYDVEVDGSTNKLNLTAYERATEKTITRRSYAKLLDYMFRKMEAEGHEFGWWKRSIMSDAEDLAQKLSRRDVVQTGTMYISALPEDILTASINNAGWSSCFDNYGENSVTPYHLVRSRRTMVAFFVPDNAEDHTLDYMGHEVINKYWRTLIFVGTSNSFVASSSSYPYQSDELVKIALNKLADLSDMTNPVLTKDFSTTYDLHGYLDGLGLAAIPQDQLGNIIKIVSPHQLCPITLEPYDDFEAQSIVCRAEVNIETCYVCEEYHHPDRMYDVVVDSCGHREHLCEYCHDDSNYCEHSEESYITCDDENVSSAFIDYDGDVSRILTYYANDNFDKYTLYLYTDSDTYETYENIYAAHPVGLLSTQDVSNLINTYRPTSYRFAFLLPAER